MLQRFYEQIFDKLNLKHHITDVIRTSRLLGTGILYVGMMVQLFFYKSLQLILFYVGHSYILIQSENGAEYFHTLCERTISPLSVTQLAQSEASVRMNDDRLPNFNTQLSTFGRISLQMEKSQRILLIIFAKLYFTYQALSLYGRNNSVFST